MTFAYAPRMRIWGTAIDGYEENVPKTTIKLGATNKEGIFMVNNEKGNGALTSPVGLITSDEVVMAGGSGYINNKFSPLDNYFLYTDSWYWTMSPSFLRNSSIANVIRIRNNDGNMSAIDLSGSGGIRPVISLQLNATYLTGDGTINNPYLITS